MPARNYRALFPIQLLCGGSVVALVAGHELGPVHRHDRRVGLGQDGGLEAGPPVPGRSHWKRQRVPQHQVPAATVEFGARR